MAKCPYEDEYRVNGPYARPSGQLLVSLVHRKTKKQTSLVYDRYLEACRQGRRIPKKEWTNDISEDGCPYSVEYRVNGPYINKTVNGRQYVNLTCRTTKKRTATGYPRLLAARYLGWRLTKDETVDHIDGDFLNNDPHNLRLVSNSRHVSEDNTRNIFTDEEINADCVWCGKRFKRTQKQLNKAMKRRKKGSAGPFCGKSCVNKYRWSVQKGETEPLLVKQMNPKQATLKEQGKVEIETIVQLKQREEKEKQQGASHGKENNGEERSNQV